MLNVVASPALAAKGRARARMQYNKAALARNQRHQRRSKVTELAPGGERSDKTSLGNAQTDQTRHENAAPLTARRVTHVLRRCSSAGHASVLPTTPMLHDRACGSMLQWRRTASGGSMSWEVGLTCHSRRHTVIASLGARALPSALTMRMRLRPFWCSLEPASSSTAPAAS